MCFEMAKYEFIHMRKMQTIPREWESSPREKNYYEDWCVILSVSWMFHIAIFSFRGLIEPSFTYVVT